MNSRTTSIVALLTLLLGGGVGGIKFVKPALDQQHKLEAEKRDLTSQANNLNNEVARLRSELNNMVMGSIAYFDLSPYAASTDRDEKRRIMEAKTVETLASLTEIFNDNHLKVRKMAPTGETQGLNKPVPTPPPPSIAPGASPEPAKAAAVATPTPTPVPGATTPPPPISLTHKTFSLELVGEYPDLVKALREIQGLPRAISINDYKVALVVDDSTKNRGKGGEVKEGEAPISPSLLSLAFDMSITYLMDTGAALGAPPPMPAPSSTPPGHAANFLAELGDWVCPPAMAAEARPRTAVRPPNALKGVVWSGNALHFQTVLGSTPKYKVVGSRPGYLVLQFERTVTVTPMVLSPQAPGIRQVVALSAPTDPLATHVAITAAPGAHLRLGSLPNGMLVVLVDQPGSHPVATAPKPAPAAVAKPVVASASKPTVAAAKPVAPGAAKPAPVGAKPVAAAVVKPAPATKPAAPTTSAVKPAAQPPAAQPVVAAKPMAQPQQNLLALLPPHRVPSTGGAAPVVIPAPVAQAPDPAPAADPLKIVVKPGGAKPVAPWEQETDHVTPEAVRAWERNRVRETAVASAPLHAGAQPPVRPLGREGVVSASTVPLAIPAHPQAHAPVAQTVVALPPHEPTPHGPAAATQIAAAPVPVAKPQAPAAKPPQPAAKPVPPAAKPMTTAAKPPAGRTPAHTSQPGDGLTRLDGVRLEGDDLVIETHGAPPSFRVLGGNTHLLLVAVDHMPTPAKGQLIRIGRSGIKQLRAALYDHRGSLTHLAIDTDGSVRLQPTVDPDGAIRFRINGPHGRPAPLTTVTATTADVTTSAVTMTNDVKPPSPTARKPLAPAHAVKPMKPLVRKPLAKPVPAAKPKPPAAKPAAVKPPAAGTAPKPVAAGGAPKAPAQGTAPLATPTPMAVPHATPGKPGAWTAPAPIATPLTIPGGKPVVTFENRQLHERAQSTYRFPIDRDRMTGRKNPFKPLTTPPPLPPGALGAPGKPGALPAVPPAPLGAGGASVPGRPLNPAAYTLKAVVIGGGAPTALISVGGKALMVGLNQTLPGNARVKSIQADYVILSSNGHDIRLHLKR